ncbi:hypothetical protein BSNK01_28410 [Bacillaceae bacterium]
MALYAFKNKVTVLDEATMNALLAAQPSSLIFDGNMFPTWNSDGSGVTELDLSQYHYIANFRVPSGVNNTIGRIELHIKKYGAGADLTVKILQGSTVLKTSIIPAKFFWNSWVSIPIDLSGLTVDTVVYSLMIQKAGDSTNHLRLISESTTDGNVGRSTDGVNWTFNQPSFHRRFFYNSPGTYKLIHGIYGENAKTLIWYDAQGRIGGIWRWLPAIDGTWKIADHLVPIYDANDVATRREVQ